MTEKPTFQVVIGNVLKILKKRGKEQEFKQEFEAIRHGDYFEFVNLIKGEIPFVIVYQVGEVTTHNEMRDTDFDYLALVKSGPSLLKFHKQVKAIYGDIVDNDLPDSAFEFMAYFEIAIRMHAKNNNLYTGRLKLIHVIDRLCDHMGLEEKERQIMHANRDFLNEIKHPKGRVENWPSTIQQMNQLVNLLNKRKLLVSKEIEEIQ